MAENLIIDGIVYMKYYTNFNVYTLQYGLYFILLGFCLLFSLLFFRQNIGKYNISSPLCIDSSGKRSIRCTVAHRYCGSIVLFCNKVRLSSCAFDFKFSKKAPPGNIEFLENIQAFKSADP